MADILARKFAHNAAVGLKIRVFCGAIDPNITYYMYPIKSSMLMTKFKHILFASLLLTACAHAPVNQAVQPDTEDQNAQTEQPAQTEPETEAPLAEAPPAEEAPVLPNVELSSDLLYEYLLSEIAAQRGNASIRPA
jgi:hypothetical protein